MSQVDTLTGLHTRSRLGVLSEEFDKRETGRVWSVAIIGLDRFEMLINIFGHITGDAVLVTLAEILKLQLRGRDTILRFGSDEFLIIFPNTTKEHAVNYGQRILENIQHTYFPSNARISLSIGFADSRDTDEGFNQIIELAAITLHRIKRSGSGRLGIFAARINSSGESLKFSHFVNRQLELKQLKALLDLSITGESQISIIVGHAGVGKSRLLKELKYYASFRGCSMITVKYDQLGQDDPYYSICRTLNSILLKMPEDELKTIKTELRHTRRAIEHLFPIFTEDDTAPSEDSDSSGRNVYFEGIACILRGLALIRPLVVIIENMHWMSKQELDLISYILRNIEESRILTCISTRPMPCDSDAHYQMNLLKTMLPVKTTMLKGLDENFTRHMTMLAMRNSNIPDNFFTDLHEKTAGNPLYIKHIVSKLHEDGLFDVKKEIPGEERPLSFSIPEKLNDIISVRIDNLDTATKEMLKFGCLEQDSFSLEMLDAISDGDRLKIAISMEKAISAGLIVEDVDTSGHFQYAFSHDLIKEYMFNSLSGALKTVLHERLAAYYRKKFDSGDKSVIAKIAGHFGQTGKKVLIRKYSLLAARRARELRSSREELKWLEQYMSSVDSGISKDENDFEVLFNLGLLYVKMGRVGEGLTLLEKAEELVADEKQRASVLYRKGLAFFELGREIEAEKLFDTAFDLSGSVRLKANILQKKGLRRIYIGEVDQAEQFAFALKKLSESISGKDSDIALSQFHSLIGLVHTRRGEFDAAVTHWDKALVLQKDLPEARASRAMLINNIGLNYKERGYFDAALSYLSDAEHEVRQMGYTNSLVAILSNTANIYRELGQSDDADTYANLCLKISEATGNEYSRLFSVLCLGMLAMENGELEKAISLFTEMGSVARKHGYRTMLITSLRHLAVSLFEQGDPNGIENILEEIEGLVEESDKDDHAVLFLKSLVATGVERITMLRSAFDKASKWEDFLERICTAHYYMKELRASNDSTEVKRVHEIVNREVMRRVKRIDNIAFRKGFLSNRYIQSILSSEFIKTMEFTGKSEKW